MYKKLGTVIVFVILLSASIVLLTDSDRYYAEDGSGDYLELKNENEYKLFIDGETFYQGKYKIEGETLTIYYISDVEYDFKITDKGFIDKDGMIWKK